MDQEGQEALKKNLELRFKASKAFNPRTPINETRLFVRRIKQLVKVIDAIGQVGAHVVIYGERGVGKTSFANVLENFLPAPDSRLLIPRIACNSADTFLSVWKRVFSSISLNQKRVQGFSETTTPFKVEEQLTEHATPDEVVGILESLQKNNFGFIVIIDEFDRIEDKPTQNLFADTIKGLSDRAIRGTLIIVGVGESVDQLIESHHSIERAIVQIHMPRMSTSELKEILEKGCVETGLQMDERAKTYICRLAQGMPYYAHLLGLYASYSAIDREVTIILIEHVAKALVSAIEETQETIRSLYHKAIHSNYKNAIYEKVLLACALVIPDERGYFSPSYVREKLRSITGKPYEIPHFMKHLNEFCEERGPILRKIGERYRPKYIFTNPLMPSHVLIRGVQSGMIKEEDLLP
ncbi:MAG: AAA family ATPase [Candidatus Omnitrophica bacterium]|nr:AAA family ATPase [Candidatus Omnitrophota bacterium]